MLYHYKTRLRLDSIESMLAGPAQFVGHQPFLLRLALQGECSFYPPHCYTPNTTVNC